MDYYPIDMAGLVNHTLNEFKRVARQYIKCIEESVMFFREGP